MNTLGWLKIFASFASVATDVVEAFVEKHPELREPPPVDEEDKLHEEFLKDVNDKFQDDPYSD